MFKHTYTATQTAKVLGVTTQCVSNLIKRNRLKAIKNSTQWVIHPESIVDYVNIRLAELSTEEKELKNSLNSLK